MLFYKELVLGLWVGLVVQEVTVHAKCSSSNYLFVSKFLLPFCLPCFGPFNHVFINTKQTVLLQQRPMLKVNKNN